MNNLTFLYEDYEFELTLISSWDYEEQQVILSKL
jgi:hypothetical protein